jgi:hypothetical protein
MPGFFGYDERSTTAETGRPSGSERPSRPPRPGVAVGEACALGRWQCGAPMWHANPPRKYFKAGNLALIESRNASQSGKCCQRLTSQGTQSENIGPHFNAVPQCGNTTFQWVPNVGTLHFNGCPMWEHYISMGAQCGNTTFQWVPN